MSYVELHFHLLPGIDDGPASLEESLELARAAVADGASVIVATPHIHPMFPNDPLEIPARVREVADRLRRERIEVKVLPGAELAHDMVERVSDRGLAAIAHGPPGRRWVLLEAPLAGLDDGFTAAADELRARGFAVVVAHPERALAGSRAGWRMVEHELALGSPLQLNAWSLAGRYGERVRLDALRLLRTAPRVVIASDAHGASRMPSLRLVLQALAETGVSDPERLARAVPHALLERGVRIAPRAAAA